MTEQESLAAHRLALARELLDDIELGRLNPDTMLLKASRLARLMDASEVQQWISLEMKGYENSWGTPVSDKYSALTGRLTDAKTRFGYWQPFAGLLAWSRVMETELQTLKVPDVHFAPSSANPNEWVGGVLGTHVATATAPVNKVLDRMAFLTKEIATNRGIVSKIMALLHEFVSTTYYELTFRGLAEGIFESHKKQIDALLAKSAGEALEKIPAIAERLAAGDREAISHAMTTCRRVLCAFADAIQPATDKKLPYGDQQIEGGPEHHLNRLRYVIKQRCKSERRETRLRQTVVNLYERFNAGTHADVTPDEARALFVELYVTLGELLSLETPAQGGGPEPVEVKA